MKIPFLKLFLAVFVLAFLSDGGICRAQTRLAIIAESPDLSPAADILTAELSKDDHVAILERAQIAKILQEQSLAATQSANKDYIKVGRLLNADGLLILGLAEKEDRQVIVCRLVAVQPGAELGLPDYDYPLPDTEQWSKLISTQVRALLPKLTVLPKDAIPLSILNLRSAVAVPDADAFEQELTLLLHDRLLLEKDFFVLERRRMELLTDEKELNPAAESPFWNGGYLIEGTIDPHGLQTNQLTLDIQITPPDKKNIITLEVSGPRTNLSQIINDAAVRITSALHKETPNTNWKPEDEAERYYQEGTWMLKWGMFQESRAAAEAAWALGKQTAESDQLRLKAYQGCAGTPGVCREVGQFNLPYIQFGINTSHLGLAERIELGRDENEISSSPKPDQFPAAIRAAELWVDGIHLFCDAGNNIDSSWFSLGLTNLIQCSQWLRYYCFTPEARNGNDDAIRQGRQLCRETAGFLTHVRTAENAAELFPVVARFTAFWTESPEETLRDYKKLIYNSEWPSVRSRLFNDVYKEISVQQKFHGATYTAGGSLTAERADLGLPPLVGWDWDTRKRCPSLWSDFIDQLGASDSPSVCLEGMILRCSYAWSVADFKTSLSRLLDYAGQHADTLADPDALAKDIEALVNDRINTLLDSDHNQIDEELTNFKRALKNALAQHKQAVSDSAEKTVRLAKLEQRESYLRTQTNFEFMSFAQTLLNGDYTAEEAAQLLPLVTNYYIRITNNVPPPGADKAAMMHEQMLQMQISHWIPVLENKLQTAPTHLPGPAHRLGPPPNSVTPTTPVEKAAAIIQSPRFWKIPPTDENNPRASTHIADWCYRDGKLWAEITGHWLAASKAVFFAVDLNDFSSHHIVFQGQASSFTEDQMQWHSDRNFDLDANYLYLRQKPLVSRYSFVTKTWSPFPLAGDSRPVRLGDRIFFISPDSILENIPTNQSLAVLASTRRRPAETLLDNLPDFNPCQMFLNTKGQVTLVAGDALYVLGADNQWQKGATLPIQSWESSKVLACDDGLLIPSQNWWGMFGPSSKPELLFRTIVKVSDPPPQWRSRPPEREAFIDGDCLWFAIDPSSSGSLYPNGPTLVRYKYGDPNPLTIAVETSASPINSPKVHVPWEHRWSILACPEGLALTTRATEGFWFIPKADLDKALTH